MERGNSDDMQLIKLGPSRMRWVGCQSSDFQTYDIDWMYSQNPEEQGHFVVSIPTGLELSLATKTDTERTVI